MYILNSWRIVFGNKEKDTKYSISFYTKLNENVPSRYTFYLLSSLEILRTRFQRIISLEYRWKIS